MDRAEHKVSFRLWEYAWFALVTGVLLVAGLLPGLFGFLARLFGVKRK
jgi:hypothetical protein